MHQRYAYIPRLRPSRALAAHSLRYIRIDANCVLLLFLSDKPNAEVRVDLARLELELASHTCDRRL